jgi:MFS family permease
MVESKLTANNPITNARLGGKAWSSIVIFGLFGQVAWVIENMYFNVFMDRTVTSNPFAVSVMVAASAVIATLTTLLAGIFSDRKGNRRHMISWGYFIWGLTVMLFSVISVENTIKIFNMNETVAIGFTVAIIVIMDCIMSAFGSFSNDAAFNAWVTDITDETNRGKAEGVLAIMPLLAVGVVFGGFDWMTQDTWRYTDNTLGSSWREGATLVSHGNWLLFFLLLGGLVTAIGIAGLFLVKDSPRLVKNEKSNYKDILYGFKPEVIKKNKNLYLAYLAMAIVGISNNTYMPYLIIYIDRTLQIANYIVAIGIVGGLAGAFSVIIGILYDKFGRRNFLIPIFISYFVGAGLMMVASPLVFKTEGTPLWIFAIAGFVLMGSHLGIGSIFTATVRDWTPKDKVGLFQGVRMFFWVLLPMVIGPMLTAIITRTSTAVGVDQFGQNIYNYSPYMFLLASGIMLLNIPVIIKLYKVLKAEKM